MKLTRIPDLLWITIFTFASTRLVSGDPPAWWSDGDPPAWDQNAEPNNKGPASIGQAKWMASEALRALQAIDSALATSIRNDLTLPQPNPAGGTFPPVLDFSVPDPKPIEWIEKQKAPLLIGQLKAIAAPFYSRLNAYSNNWLTNQRTANGTNQPNSIFPWTNNASTDENRAMATVGHLKAVFSLHFDTLENITADLDNDGIADQWERSFAEQLMSLGAPLEQWGTNYTMLQSGDLNPSARLQEDGMSFWEIYKETKRIRDDYILHDLFIQGQRAEFLFGVNHKTEPSSDGSPPWSEGSGRFVDGSPGYGDGTIETWSRSLPVIHNLNVSLDPFSVSPNTSLEWFINESQHALWSYHTNWEEEYLDDEPRTLFPLEEINQSSEIFKLNKGGLSTYFQLQKQILSKTVTEWKGENQRSKFRLFRPIATNDSTTKNFLKLTTEHEMVMNDSGYPEWAPAPPVLTVESISVTIPAYGHTSSWIETTPQVVAQKSRSVELLPVELTAHKRGTIAAPGEAIPRPKGSEVYEVVTLENADYDETNWQPTSMSDGSLEGKQDGRTDVVSKDKDDDFVKLRFSCPLSNMAGSSEVVFDQAGQGERMQEGHIRFYNRSGERVELSALKIDDLKNPSGPLAPAFTSGLDLFVEIGDLGTTTTAQGSAESTTRKYADLIWKITIGATTIEQKVRIYRGGFWRNDRTNNSGTIALYDGKGIKPDGTIEYGQIVKGPYQILTGREDTEGNWVADETTEDYGPTPRGWYGLWDRNPSDGKVGMRNDWLLYKGEWYRPQTNHLVDKDSNNLGFVQQGSYCQWAQAGNRNIEGKGAFGYDNDNDSDPYQGMPASIHFKFELSPIGSFTTRTFLQIHPDGFCDGTAGCVGIQSYGDCAKVLYLVRHYFQTRLLVD